LAAAVVFAMANLCPAVRINLRGLYGEATLWQSAPALTHSQSGLIAVPTVPSVIVVPFAQIGLLAWGLAFVRDGRRAPGFTRAMRVLVALWP